MSPTLQADPCSVALNGECPIHVAVAQSCPSLLACLVQGVPGETLDDLRDSQGNNPLHGVAMVSVSSDQDMQHMAELLLYCGMQIDSKGESSLLLSSQCCLLKTKFVRESFQWLLGTIGND